MANSDRTFIRVYGDETEPTLESVETPKPNVVALHSDEEGDLKTHAASESSVLAGIAGNSCQPRVICEVYDYQSVSGTNVITTGLFLDAVEQAAERRQSNSAARQKSTFASWEVDRFELPRPCEVIEQCAPTTIDDIFARVLQSNQPTKKLV